MVVASLLFCLRALLLSVQGKKECPCQESGTYSKGGGGDRCAKNMSVPLSSWYFSYVKIIIISHDDANTKTHGFCSVRYMSK